MTGLFADSTLDLLRDPYRFISRRARQLGADAFETRIALRRVICLTGAAGARLFYDPERFRRQGAMPEPVEATLFGRGGVQSLDGDAHRHRKALFLEVLTDEAVRRLGELADAEWRRTAERSTASGPIDLYELAKRVHCRAVCAWAGVPLADHEVADTARDLAVLFEGVASLGPRHLAARFARRRLERRMAGLVRDVRDGRIEARGTPLAAFASHRDLEGRLLPARVAAVDLLSILRPAVVGALFVVWCAVALETYPEWQTRLVDRASPDLEPFVQEVRRVYPFAPFAAARVRTDFTWEGLRVREGTFALLDLFGIDHDPRIWTSPEAFLPERLRGIELDPFGFVPHGGGDAASTHRCAGETATVELMEIAVVHLAARLDYQVMPGDLRVRWRSMPPLPRGRFLIEGLANGGVREMKR